MHGMKRVGNRDTRQLELGLALSKRPSPYRCTQPGCGRIDAGGAYGPPTSFRAASGTAQWLCASHADASWQAHLDPEAVAARVAMRLHAERAAHEIAALRPGALICLGFPAVRGAPRRPWMKGEPIGFKVERRNGPDSVEVAPLVSRRPRATLYVRPGFAARRRAAGQPTDDRLDTMLAVYGQDGFLHRSEHPVTFVGIVRSRAAFGHSAQVAPGHLFDAPVHA